MYEIDVYSKSLCPYIQNNPELEIPMIQGTNAITPIGKRKEDPEHTGYKNGKGYFIPSRQFWGCFREAAKMVKLRKMTMGKLYKAIIAPIEPFEIIMYQNGEPIKQYDQIYNEPVFKPNGEMVFNPRLQFNNWECHFVITVLDDCIPMEKIKEIVVNGGLYKGIGSRRPMYGRFMNTKFEKIGETK